MRAKEECYSCLENLARRTAELAILDVSQKEEILKKGLDYLAQNFSYEKIPASIAGEMQRIIRNLAVNKDPFAFVKEKEMEIARELSKELGLTLEDNLDALISFAALGNSIDFFLDLNELKKEVKKPVVFAKKETQRLYSLLDNFKMASERKTILYFADNAGECYFDLLLILKLEEFAEVIYVVKENPVQNDLTLIDLEKSGIRKNFKKVMTTGTDTPGLDLSLVSKEFSEALRNAGLLFAKGMGYYETLPELSLSVPAFYLLKAKCLPIARSLKVELNDYVAIMI